jgi:DNA-binding transcriptional MocR family regulator
LKQSWITGQSAGEIAASIERGVRVGRVGAHHALPTVRELARALRVSPATVAAAYKQLRVRGVVAGQGRQGTRVAVTPVARLLGELSDIPAGAVDLATGNPDPALLPSLDGAAHLLSRASSLYGDRAQLPELVAFAAADFEADGVPGHSISVIGGALDGIDRVLREHARAGDRVAVEDPAFPGLPDLLTASGLVPIPVAVDDEGPRGDVLDMVLRQRCGVVIITPRAQNPTGAALSPPRATELRRVLRRFPEVLLVENDDVGPVAGVRAATLVDRARERWAVIRSTSKFLGPDLRLAVMAADDLTTARVQTRQAVSTRWVSHMLQRMTLALWSDPASGRRVARAADIYAVRRTAFLDALQSHGIAAHGRTGFNVWIPVREEARTVRGLGDRGWAVAAGERFRIAAPPAVRVTTSALTPIDAERLAADLAAVLRPARPVSA